MKFNLAVIAALFAQSDSVSADTDNQACMFCKRSDTMSGFLTSYTYCPDKEAEVCIKNFSEYIQQGKQCIQDTKDGWALDVNDDCHAEPAEVKMCRTFKSIFGQTKEI